MRSGKDELEKYKNRHKIPKYIFCDMSKMRIPKKRKAHTEEEGNTMEEQSKISSIQQCHRSHDHRRSKGRSCSSRMMKEDVEEPNSPAQVTNQTCDQPNVSVNQYEKKEKKGQKSKLRRISHEGDSIAKIEIHDDFDAKGNDHGDVAHYNMDYHGTSVQASRSSGKHARRSGSDKENLYGNDGANYDRFGRHVRSSVAPKQPSCGHAASTAKHYIEYHDSSTHNSRSSRQHPRKDYNGTNGRNENGNDRNYDGYTTRQPSTPPGPPPGYQGDRFNPSFHHDSRSHQSYPPQRRNDNHHPSYPHNARSNHHPRRHHPYPPPPRNHYHSNHSSGGYHEQHPSKGRRNSAPNDWHPREINKRPYPPNSHRRLMYHDHPPSHRDNHSDRHPSECHDDFHPRQDDSFRHESEFPPSHHVMHREEGHHTNGFSAPPPPPSRRRHPNYDQRYDEGYSIARGPSRR